MTQRDLQRFRQWCLTSGVLVGRVLRHPTFGHLKIRSSDSERVDAGIKFSATLLGPDQLRSWFSQDDQEDLFRLWRSAERGEAPETAAERRAAKTAEREAANRAKRLCDVQALFEEALSDDIVKRVGVRCGVPDSADHEISRRWAGDGARDGQRARMLSARLAERAAAKFYKGIGKTVVDVSISQIDGRSSNCDWRDYDLLVDDQPIDIKNARTLREHPDRYVSHCVPVFKESRGIAVRVAGVLSPWASMETLSMGEVTVTFLGETSEQEFSRLQMDANATPSRFEIYGSLTSAKFLPPWIFNYPDECYRRRASAIETFSTFADEQWIAWAGDEFNVRPAIMLAGRMELLGRLGLSEGQRRVAVALAAFQESGTLSVSSIFVALLQHFIECLHRGEMFDATECRSLLFWNNHADRPAFLFDPLETIQKLIDTLHIVQSRGGQEIRTFTSFRLAALNLLLGRRSDETRWSSLIAYCGGWMAGRRCGTVPLIIGEHQLCSCRRLICPNCGFCSQSCDAALIRSSGPRGQFEED